LKEQLVQDSGAAVVAFTPECSKQQHTATADLPTKRYQTLHNRGTSPFQQQGLASERTMSSMSTDEGVPAQSYTSASGASDASKDSNISNRKSHNNDPAWDLHLERLLEPFSSNDEELHEAKHYVKTNGALYKLVGKIVERNKARLHHAERQSSQAKGGNDESITLARMLENGLVIEEDYANYFVKGRKLGEGGFGVVYEATEKATGVKYAIKMVNGTKWSEKENFKFVDEVAIMKDIVHPNVVRLHKVYQYQSRRYAMVMDLCTGGELFDRIKRFGCFKEPVAKQIIREILSALKYMHIRRTVHRDLKPENILFAREEDLHIKIADFGFAKSANIVHGQPKIGGAVGTIDEESDRVDTSPNGATAPPSMANQAGISFKTKCGSPNYVAPEVLFSSSGYGVECDIWSVGVVLYIMLCGYFPFSARNTNTLYKLIKDGRYQMPSDEWDSISKEGKDLVRQMLQVDTRKRISAAKALEHPWLLSSSNEMSSDQAIENEPARSEDPASSIRSSIPEKKGIDGDPKQRRWGFFGKKDKK